MEHTPRRLRVVDHSREGKRGVTMSRPGPAEAAHQPVRLDEVRDGAASVFNHHSLQGK